MSEMSTTQPATGWLCPVCGAVYAPWVASCLQCPKTAVTFRVTEPPRVCPVCLGDPLLPPPTNCNCGGYHIP